MSRNWNYDWMISCPAVLVLGEATYGSFKGLATLTLLYPRVVALNRGGFVKVINSIPEYLNRSLIEEICLDLLKTERRDPVEEALRRTMFYGGYNVFLTSSRGSFLNIIFELVNTSKIFLYIRRTEGKLASSRLEHWVALGVGLRTGDFQLISECCSEIGRLESNRCYIRSINYELLITNMNIAIEGFSRVLPDNNPARHVVKL